MSDLFANIMSYIDLPLYLAWAVGITGVITLLYKVGLVRVLAPNHKPWLVETSQSLFPVLLIVFIIRSFIVEPYKIPSGSLEPSLLVGDFIVVNKYSYGIRHPISNTQWFGINKPKTGDIMVFKWPPNPKVYFIKRVVGTPGDRVQYIDNELYINGKKEEQKFVEHTVNSEGHAVEKRAEQLEGVEHNIYVNPKFPSENYDVVVPEGHYFMVGDNRNASADSRSWGFVPDNRIVGKAVLVWMSWNSEKTWFRGSRIGKLIK